MRWKEPKTGDTRICEGFLWRAKTIDGETRWLERARWREVRKGHNRASGVNPALYVDWWESEMWLPLDPEPVDPTVVNTFKVGRDGNASIDPKAILLSPNFQSAMKYMKSVRRASFR